MQTLDKIASFAKTNEKAICLLIGIVCILIMMVIAPRVFERIGDLYCDGVVETKDDSWSDLNVRFGYACTRDNKCSDPIFLLSGVIKKTSNDVVKNEIERLVKTHSEVKTICFDSRGGANDGALDISNLITSYHFDTCLAPKYLVDGKPSSSRVQPHCESLCAWLLSAGQRRIAYSPVLKIGFHASGVHHHKCLPTYYVERNYGAKKYLAETLLPQQFLSRSETTINKQKMLNLLDWSFTIDPAYSEFKTSKELMDQFGYFTSVLN